MSARNVTAITMCLSSTPSQRTIAPDAVRLSPPYTLMSMSCLCTLCCAQQRNMRNAFHSASASLMPCVCVSSPAEHRLLSTCKSHMKCFSASGHSGEGLSFWDHAFPLRGLTAMARRTHSRTAHTARKRAAHANRLRLLGIRAHAPSCSAHQQRTHALHAQPQQRSCPRRSSISSQ
jgi:hypothetical protein